MTTKHEARIEKLHAIIIKNTTPGWHLYTVPRIGQIAVNCKSYELQESAPGWGSQCWLRYDRSTDTRLDGSLWADDSSAGWNEELRGSAMDVAKELCRILKAPSKAVQETVEVIERRWFGDGLWTIDGMRAEEVAAWLNLDTELTFKALDLLAERGFIRDEGARGVFRQVA